MESLAHRKCAGTRAPATFTRVGGESLADVGFGASEGQELEVKQPLGKTEFEPRSRDTQVPPTALPSEKAVDRKWPVERQVHEGGSDWEAGQRDPEEPRAAVGGNSEALGVWPEQDPGVRAQA